ncbi:phosphonate transport system substrate-binding protein [Clostridium pascui]|uniref:phosphate/phosphite/phosphonate ABC transporter substrate-binding protein n=1 Tax=Clostridium pascui TaxID=46609 RepID=UPI0019568D3D|nr:phosphate/phosphite/phosphonate ABC transporter substrate-binding protein [Clostridium pascui]MBM7870671.1 phosphonate transport system substrate-binding protein [Clostridium pascui]
MNKRILVTILTLILVVLLIVSCADKTKDTPTPKAYIPKELTVQFVPSHHKDTLEEKIKPLESLLSKQLGIPVKASVATNYTSTIEAMSSKEIDVGFLPPLAYVLAKDRGIADILLQAQRYSIQEPSGKTTKDLVDYYRSMIVVKKNSDIKKLEDLKGKRVAFQGTTSAGGYIWPVAEMKKAGINIQTDIEQVTLNGHDTAVLAVLNDEVDAAAVFEDARNTVKEDIKDVFDKVVPIYFSKPIPNDTISVRSDMSPEWKTNINDAFINISKDPVGRKILNDVYSHAGYIKSTDNKFDIVREYKRLVENNTP